MTTNNQFHFDKEELANMITHGIGVIASSAGLGFLLYFAIMNGTIWEQISFGIFGSTMLMVFIASTIYHTIRNPKWKVIFQTVLGPR